MKAKIDEIKPLRMSLSSVEALKGLKDTTYWSAIKEYIILYIEQQKSIAWHLNESQEDMPIRHAKLTARGEGLVDFVKFVEKDIRRSSQLNKSGDSDTNE